MKAVPGRAQASDGLSHEWGSPVSPSLCRDKGWCPAKINMGGSRLRTLMNWAVFLQWDLGTGLCARNSCSFSFHLSLSQPRVAHAHPMKPALCTSRGLRN